MAVSVVVGGQFGSEGKGKVALAVARREGAGAAVRVGGPNSGHTARSADGTYEVLRQLPTAALLEDALCVLAAGAYIDVPVLLEEIERVGLAPDRLLIDRRAMLVTSDDRAAEAGSDIQDRIGSTASGTGAAVARRVARRPEAKVYLAEQSRYLKRYVGDASAALREILDGGERVVVEGTQGFGLSLLHSPYYPFATSRDTTAAGAISEAGLSPRDVDRVILVLRSFPIRVAGNSGPLPREIDWETVRSEGEHEAEIAEYTSVTGRLRRVARFDAEIVRQAICVNRPDEIVLNHVDYLDSAVGATGRLTQKAADFVREVEEAISARVDHVGLGAEEISPVRHPADLAVGPPTQNA